MCALCNPMTCILLLIFCLEVCMCVLCRVPLSVYVCPVQSYAVFGSALKCVYVCGMQGMYPPPILCSVWECLEVCVCVWYAGYVSSSHPMQCLGVP
jgi:hypothetical protein